MYDWMVCLTRECLNVCISVQGYVNQFFRWIFSNTNDVSGVKVYVEITASEFTIRNKGIMVICACIFCCVVCRKICNVTALLYFVRDSEQVCVWC